MRQKTESSRQLADHLTLPIRAMHVRDPEDRGCGLYQCGMAVPAMIHGRDARATSDPHSMRDKGRARKGSPTNRRQKVMNDEWATCPVGAQHEAEGRRQVRQEKLM